MDLIALAIPFFFGLIAVEYVAGLIKKRRIYRFNDSVNDLSLGILDQVGGAFVGVLLLINYTFVWQRFRILDMGASSALDVVGISAVVWVTCFFARDCMYYWAHRMSHEMNIGWATHIAHHQSEEFNLSVALRQGVFQGLFFNFFYLPLAFIGFPPGVYFICGGINTLYQFWIHTRLIGKLGPIEWVMNTPSHHRVHHGSNPKYIDRNHAGVFIIWDRMFGTFQEEEEEPDYGIVTPLKSWNPVWGQIHYLVKLCKTAWAAPYWADKFRVWVREPAWVPRGLEAPADFVPETRRPGYRKYNARGSRSLHRYIYVQFALLLLIVTGYLGGEGAMPWSHRWVCLLTVVATVMSFGAMFEGKWWALPLEIGRIAALAGQFVAFGGAYYGWPALQGPVFNGIVIVGALGSIVWFWQFRAHFRKTLPLPAMPAELSLPEAQGESVQA